MNKATRETCTQAGRACNFRPSDFGGAFCLRCDRRITQFCKNDGTIMPEEECPDHSSVSETVGGQPKFDAHTAKPDNWV